MFKNMCVYTHIHTYREIYECSNIKCFIFYSTILLSEISNAFVFLFRLFYSSTFSKVHITFIIIKKDLKAKNNDSKVNPRMVGPFYPT